MVKYRLVYFDFKGRGELVRLIFAAAGVEYEDKRLMYSPTSPEWLAYKPSTPFNKLPVLEIISKSDEEVSVEEVKRLAQSITIARYLSNQFGLSGDDDWERAEADEYADQITELADKIVEFHLETDGEKQKAMVKKLEEEILPENLTFFEKKILQNKSGFLVGSRLSWTDLYLFSVLEWLGDEMKKKTLEKFAIIREHEQRLNSIKNISDWLAKRPFSIY